MKPTKNIVYCNNSGRRKMLFETEKKAENFMKFNNAEIAAKSGYNPQRSYYCIFCLGWHITSIKYNIGSTKKEQLTEKLSKKEKTIKKSDNFSIVISNYSENKAFFEKQEERKKIEAEEELKREERKIIKQNKIQNIEDTIINMTIPEKEKFFSENINALNVKIESLNNESDINNIKKLRNDLNILYIVRKKHIQNTKKNSWKYKN